jgi:predicted amidohydrolase YtcJ
MVVLTEFANECLQKEGKLRAGKPADSVVWRRARKTLEMRSPSR